MAGPTRALVMRSDPVVRRETAAALGEFGLAVTEFADECHLYAHAIRLAAAPGVEPGSFIIVAEPSEGVVRDLEILRGGSRRVPLVLVGPGADPQVAGRLFAACLASEHPTGAQLRRAIDTALALSTRRGPFATAPDARRLISAPGYVPAGTDVAGHG